MSDTGGLLPARSKFTREFTSGLTARDARFVQKFALSTAVNKVRTSTSTMPLSRHCRPEVWDYYRAQMAHLEQTDALLGAAGAVAWQQLPAAHPELSLRRIDAIARQVQQRLRSGQIQAILAHLHDILFEELDFHGSTENYYLPANSFLPTVLHERVGLPVLLALIYKGVGERLGLQIEGVNTPGHFLVAVKTEVNWQLLDPFARGRLLTIDEAERWIGEILGRKVALAWEDLPIATHGQWLARLIMNLLAIYQQTGEATAFAALKELYNAIPGIVPIAPSP